METAEEVELHALIEKLDVADLPIAAAAMLRAWCTAKGAGHDDVYEFFAAITELQSGRTRQQLDLMSATYRSGKLFDTPSDTD
jgi:hypothetical protein